jgi:uncharacterized protein (DUF488 family)
MRTCGDGTAGLQPGHDASPAPALLTVGHGTLGSEELAQLLASAGVQLVADVRSAPGSRRHPHFGRSGSFAAGLAGLLGDAAACSTAAMCAETPWWRCHRRLVADAAVLLEGTSVYHLGHDGRLAAHRVTDGARMVERDGTTRLVYDDAVAPAGHGVA